MKKWHMYSLLIASMAVLEVTHSFQGGLLLIKNDYSQQCSRSQSQFKYQKNYQEYQQRMYWCNKGNMEACQKAQQDYQSMQKHQYLMMNCPFP